MDTFKWVVTKVIPYLLLLWFVFALFISITGMEVNIPPYIPDSLYLISSGACVFFAIQHYHKTARLLRIGVKTTADVIALERSSTGMGDTFCPKFEYLDQSDIKRTFFSSWASDSPSYRVGDRVRIVYHPYTFEAKVCKFWVLYRRIFFLILLAAYLFLCGIV